MARLLSLIGAPGAQILCFHGITTPELASRSDVHLPVAKFKSLIAGARRVGRLVPLQDLVARHRAGRSTAGLVAVTLDDAYASLLGETADFIRREAIPLTVFVVANAATYGSAYWWDRIDDLFPQVPRERWRAFEDAVGLPSQYRNGQPAEYGPLRPLRQWILAAHKGRCVGELDQLLMELEHERGTRTAHRSMTFTELASFAALPSVTLGVHTVSHPVLPLLGDDELRGEIAASHDALRERFQNVLPILAIPFGLFDDRTVRVARQAGMTTSLTLAGTTFNPDSDGDDLPRFCITRNDTAFKLQLRLSRGALLARLRRPRLTPSRYPALPSPTT
ncbi:MAG TPA: polysaccharide deacetylase family protein [Gemmatimonadales bacterium]|nr:polysaccharide deacetylase family protein [Gemmatimonadales bacterium]